MTQSISGILITHKNGKVKRGRGALSNPSFETSTHVKSISLNGLVGGGVLVLVVGWIWGGCGFLEEKWKVR